MRNSLGRDTALHKICEARDSTCLSCLWNLKFKLDCGGSTKKLTLTVLNWSRTGRVVIPLEAYLNLDWLSLQRSGLMCTTTGRKPEDSDVYNPGSLYSGVGSSRRWVFVPELRLSGKC
jgi:hypothetical protein